MECIFSHSELICKYEIFEAYLTDPDVESMVHSGHDCHSNEAVLEHKREQVRGGSEEEAILVHAVCHIFMVG